MTSLVVGLVIAALCVAGAFLIHRSLVNQARQRAIRALHAMEDARALLQLAPEPYHGLRLPRQLYAILQRLGPQDGQSVLDDWMEPAQRADSLAKDIDQFQTPPERDPQTGATLKSGALEPDPSHREHTRRSLQALTLAYVRFAKRLDDLLSVLRPLPQYCDREQARIDSAPAELTVAEVALQNAKRAIEKLKAQRFRQMSHSRPAAFNSSGLTQRLGEARKLLEEAEAAFRQQELLQAATKAQKAHTEAKAVQAEAEEMPQRQASLLKRRQTVKGHAANLKEPLGTAERRVEYMRLHYDPAYATKHGQQLEKAKALLDGFRPRLTKLSELALQQNWDDADRLAGEIEADIVTIRETNLAIRAASSLLAQTEQRVRQLLRPAQRGRYEEGTIGAAISHLDWLLNYRRGQESLQDELEQIKQEVEGIRGDLAVAHPDPIHLLSRLTTVQAKLNSLDERSRM